MPTPHPIPRFLLPGGVRGLRAGISPGHLSLRNSANFTTTQTKRNSNDPKRTLSQPDKFRPPSHPARRVVQTRNGKIQTREPVNYPGPRLSDKEREAQKNRQYPNMFPPEGTVMFKFLTSRWIHIWIAMVLSFSFHIPIYISISHTFSYTKQEAKWYKHTGRPNNPRNIHIHHQLPPKLTLRAPPPALVRPPHVSVFDRVARDVRLPDARAAHVCADAREAHAAG